MKKFIFKHAHACVLICSFDMYMCTCSLEFFKIYGPKSQKGFLVVLGCMQIGKMSAQFWMVQPCLSTRAENLMRQITNEVIYIIFVI